MKKRKIGSLLICIWLILGICACENKQENLSANTSNLTDSQQIVSQSADSSEPQLTPINYGPDSYDSLDTAILLSKDEENSKVTLYNMEVDKSYTLDVVGTSTLYDKYKEPLSLKQMQPGDIVEVTFLKDIKRLNSMQLATNGWTMKEAGRYTLDWERKSATIGEDVFHLPEDVLLLSEGKKIEPMDLNNVDILSFQGVDNSICSIVVEKGHGYLRLENDINFVGGFIEVGQSQIRKISEDMLLTVPEGKYQVVISHNGGGGTKNVTIARNQEVTLDIGDLEVAQVQYGTVIFTANADDVMLYVDGNKVDPDAPLSLEYGIHQIIARAEGYNTMTSYFKLNKASTGIDLVLDKTKDVEKEEQKDTEYYRVYIDAPKEAEVYLDGNYVGIAPASFKKEAGTHTITLRKSGYETRSYTIVIDDEEKDISYSFADLVEILPMGLENVIIK